MLGRFIAPLATAIGVVTGVGTIVGWLASAESLSDVGLAALGYAGMAYWTAAALAFVVCGLMPNRLLREALEGFFEGFFFGRPPKRLLRPLIAHAWSGRLLVFAMGGAVMAFGVVAFGTDPDTGIWRSLGIIGVVVAAVIVVVVVLELLATHRRAYRDCPDCAERIKSAAIVCRYCGRRSIPEPRDTTVIYPLDP